MSEKKTAYKILEETSRTFYIPIMGLPQQCKEAVASQYLTLRAIDEIEDHSTLQNHSKALLLRNVSYTCQKYKPGMVESDLIFNWLGYEKQLKEVTLRLSEWLMFCPQAIRAKIVQTTSSMADKMAFWVERNWEIKDQADLDAYTFSVAGSVGLQLCEIWDWFEGTKTDRDLALGYGRGLQSINILINSAEDSQRGVTFYPKNWSEEDMIKYCTNNLKYAKQYISTLKQKTAAYNFCIIPYLLADATLNARRSGKNKLNREEVIQIVKRVKS